MKILLVSSHNMGGVEYYRMMAPNHYLSKLYPEYEFDSVQDIQADTYKIAYTKTWNADTQLMEESVIPPEQQQEIPMDEFLKRYDLIHFCRGIDVYGSSVITDRVKRLGIPFGLDLDDYWVLPPYHILYEDYKTYKKSEAIIQAIKDAMFITCTTKYLAQEIKKYNKNIYILENGIDHEEEMWQPDDNRNERLRFGFYQGTTHFKDIQMVAPSMHKLFADKELKDKFQVVLAGFQALPDVPSVYIAYEWLITNKLEALADDEQYLKYLAKCTMDDNEQYLNKKYYRIWATHIDNWAFTYHFTDVSLVPLIQDRFNCGKSELKMIEAGMKGKACIVSNVTPYTLIANDENSYLCTDGMNSFYKRIKRAINNPVEVEDKAAQLRYDVIQKYSLKVLTPKRKQLYDLYK